MGESFEKDVTDRLARIETKLSNGVIKNLNDHEKRIRFLEKSIWAAIGILGLLNVLLKFWV